MSRFVFYFATLFIPALSAAGVGGSIYMQGLASPFLGILIGIAGLFFATKLLIGAVCIIDDLEQSLRKRLGTFPSQIVAFRDRIARVFSGVTVLSEA